AVPPTGGARRAAGRGAGRGPGRRPAGARRGRRRRGGPGRRRPDRADRVAVRQRGVGAAGRAGRPGRRPGPDPDLAPGGEPQPGRRRGGLPLRLRPRAPGQSADTGRHEGV
ncbi:MAG: hypothetical protein AVDCRST_MAG41-3720, partial [uncultured Corynebacteriales bacterium]